MHPNAKDLTGQQFGRLTAIRPTDIRYDNKIVWECVCVCGNRTSANVAALTSGRKASCGCLLSFSKRSLTVGQRRERLTITGYVRPGYWGYRCDCGSTGEITASNFWKTKSCGCYRDEIRVTHGLSGHPLYKRWHAMLERCRNPQHQNYHLYGGRGIHVCERWQRFENFLSDMGLPPDGYTLDRIRVDEGYRPDNCRWADGSTQAKNKRSRKDVVLAALDDQALEAELARRRSVFG